MYVICFKRWSTFYNSFQRYSPASIAGTNIRRKISSHKSDLLLLYSRIVKQLKIIDNNAEPLFPKNKSFLNYKPIRLSKKTKPDKYMKLNFPKL